MPNFYETEKATVICCLSNLELELNPCPPDLFLVGCTPANSTPLRSPQTYD